MTTSGNDNATRQSSSMLRLVDLAYIIFSLFAGGWQAWCVGWGRNSLWSTLMGLPFSLASHIYALSKPDFVNPPRWKRMFILSAGMPVSFVVGALTVGAETGIMYVLGFGTTDLPLYSIRLLLGEGAACLVWAKCLQLWLQSQRLAPSRSPFLSVFAPLYSGVIATHGLWLAVHRFTPKNIYFYLMSTVVTLISALIVIIKRTKLRSTILS